MRLIVQNAFVQLVALAMGLRVVNGRMVINESFPVRYVQPVQRTRHTLPIKKGMYVITDNATIQRDRMR